MTAPAHEPRGRVVAPGFRAVADPTLGVGFAVVSALVFLAVKEGGYDPTIWYPTGLAVVGVGLVAFHGGVLRRELPRRVWLAIGALAAYTCWVAAAVAWATVKGVAWDGANMTALYLVLFALVVVLPWRSTNAAVTLGAFGAAAALTGIVELERASRSADPAAWFSLGRFAAPFGYQNAACAWYVLAAWPLLRLASQRTAPVVVRTLAGAALASLPALALLCQSRASVVAAPIAAALYLLLVPGTARSIVYLALAVLPAVVWHGRLLHVFPAIRDEAGVGSAVGSARDAVLLAALMGGAGSLALALADRAVAGARMRQVARTGVLAAAAAAAVAALIAGAVAIDHPEARARTAWHDFKVTTPPTSGSYFARGLGGNRYDIWRVASDVFSERPLAGIGADNFLAEYLRRRATALETPRYPHSLELRILSQTGVVGAVLFAAFLAAIVSAARRLRRLPHEARAWSGVGLVMAGYWLVHGSVDWFWEIPALGGVAFLATGIAVSLQGGVPGPATWRAPRRRHREVAAAAVTAGSLAVAASFVFPWLAAEDVVLAGSSWRGSPADAYARLDTAARLNPLSSQPYLVEGVIAAHLGDRERMIRSFSDALRRDRHEWFAEVELAVAHLSAGQVDAASAHLARARRLNPLDPSLAVVAAAIRDDRRLRLTALDAYFLERT